MRREQQFFGGRVRVSEEYEDQTIVLEASYSSKKKVVHAYTHKLYLADAFAHLRRNFEGGS